MSDKPKRLPKPGRVKFQTWLDPDIRPSEQGTIDGLDSIRLDNPDASDRDILAAMVSHFRGEKIQPPTTEARLMKKLTQLEKKIDTNNELLLDRLINVLNGLDLSSYVRDDGRSMQDEIGGLIPDETYKHTFQGVYGASFEDE